MKFSIRELFISVYALFKAMNIWVLLMSCDI